MSNENVKIVSPEPPADLYEAQETDTRTQRMLNEQKQHYILKDIEFPEDGGILVHHQGFLYPLKGYPDFQKMPVVNEAKRLLVGYIRLFGMKEIMLCLSLLVLFPWKYKRKVLQQFLHGYSALANPVIAHAYRNEDYLSKFTKAFRNLLFTFLESLGIEYHVIGEFTKIIATIMELDFAYRWRVQDIFSLTTSRKLSKSPVGELRRILKIYTQRERSLAVKGKFEAIGRIATMAFLHPKVRKAWRRAVELSEFEDLQFDEGDRYRVGLETGYDYMGKTKDQRMREFTAIHSSQLPPMITATMQEVPSLVEDGI